MRRAFKIFGGLLDLISPPKCAVCKELSRELICVSCWDKVAIIDGAVCRYCGRPTLRPVARCRDCRGKRLYFNWAVSAWRYSGAGKDIIHALKYENERRLAPVLARKLIDKLPPEETFDFVTWVPLHRSKKTTRGYNQSEIIAKEIAVTKGLPAKKIIKKTRKTLDQNKLAMPKRQTNISDAFKLYGSMNISGKKILIIDDVYTTGATVNECCKTIRDGGAARIGVLTLARALRE